ncbi:trans-sulfuration enzyme family protein [Natronogracilivirga saccharolytica]|uniref:O-succinylhomoserine sulfhydrylase n=1 Tax=Natronogracilivirga saccharolytica TaxID=2812953 RepID=A0A8J7UWI5_9BACT|nr:aminotransferase class I/II-fold pyridoxal phosphate-dependent enzyme [Natronogracilivirga saccharolytica]MBP3193667.1 PLP-dependent transferase [Natronogracilivirga saccharolytica]
MGRKFETNAIRTQTERSQNREHSSPVYLTSSFVFDSAEHGRELFANETEGNVYSRYSNPNTDEFIRKICELEGADDGIATASGMAAVFSSLVGLLDSGDHILVGRSVFGSTHQILTELLPRWNITHTYVDITDPGSWEPALRPETRMFFLETPSNPGLDILDLQKATDLSKKHELILNVDNCFATPYLQQPGQYGADLIIHSATKFIDGQGRTLGGIIVGREDLIEKLRFFARHAGPAMSPFNAWVLSKSLETLAVRMDRHCSNALHLAGFLEKHENVSWVRYPFLPSHPQFKLAKKQMAQGGGVLVFHPEGGYSGARLFIDKLRMLSLSSNLGDTRTIVTHPASTTHSKLTEEERLAVGITPGLVRISVGLEHIDDIIDDVAQALDQL